MKVAVVLVGSRSKHFFEYDVQVAVQLYRADYPPPDDLMVVISSTQNESTKTSYFRIIKRDARDFVLEVLPPSDDMVFPLVLSVNDYVYNAIKEIMYEDLDKVILSRYD